MNTRTLLTVLITMMSGAVCAAEETQAMTLDDAQLATGRSTDEVRAADANGDQRIDAAEFAALTVAPGDVPADATENSGAPARK